MSFSHLVRQVQIDRSAEQLAEVAAFGLSQRGEVLMRLRTDVRFDVLEKFSHYESVPEYVREKIESDPCIICGASPLGGEFIERRGGTAARVATDTNRIHSQQLRVITMVVLLRLDTAINALEFDSQPQLATANRRVYGSGSARLSKVGANRAWRAPAAFHPFVFVEPALRAARRARNAFVARSRRSPRSIDLRNIGGPALLDFLATRDHAWVRGRSFVLMGNHAAFCGIESSGRISARVTAPYEASTYFQQFDGRGRRISRSSRYRYASETLSGSGRRLFSRLAKAFFCSLLSDFRYSGSVIAAGLISY